MPITGQFQLAHFSTQPSSAAGCMAFRPCTSGTAAKIFLFMHASQFVPIFRNIGNELHTRSNSCVVLRNRNLPWLCRVRCQWALPRPAAERPFGWATTAQSPFEACFISSSRDRNRQYPITPVHGSLGNSKLINPLRLWTSHAELEWLNP
jgi:hypothetical protein